MGAASYKELFTNGSSYCTRASQESVSSKELMRMIKSQEFRCAISGQLIDPGTSELDHKIPYAKGGKHEMNNVQWVSKDINRMKGAMPNDEFIRLCKLVAEWNR